MSALTIRLRIALAAGTLTGLTVLLFAGFSLGHVHRAQLAAIDVELFTEAQLVARLLAHGDVPEEQVDLPGLGPSEPWVTFALVSAEGRVWRARPDLPDEVITQTLPPGLPRTIDHADRQWRTQAFALKSSAVVIAYDLGQVMNTLAKLLLAYALALPVAMLVAALGGWWAAGVALAPLRRLTEAAAAIGAPNLNTRVPVPDADDEVAQLATVVNAMLARLERSFQQAEHFAADASHELRTPLTIMRGEIEALLHDAGLPPTLEPRLLSLQEEIDRLTRITDNLLLLARFDAGQAPLDRQTVDLGALASAVVEDIEVFASAHNIQLETHAPPGLYLSGDAELLQRLLINLLANGIKFNTPGGRVRCAIAGEETAITLTVGNTGPGIPEGLRPRVFERFFRADQARTQTGYGLGLALCREIARAHGGDITLPTSTPGWTEFVVRLPRNTS